MDELRSSEALEREIREDSRKRAEKLLKQAEEETRRYLDADAREAQAELDGLRRKYAEKAGAYRREHMARLPMDKKRRRIEWAQARLDAALKAEFSLMGDEDLLDLMLPRLRSVSGFFHGKGCAVRVSGLGGKAVRDSLSPILPGLSPGAIVEEGSDAMRGVRVTSEDGRIMFGVSEESLRDELLDDYRAELVAALLGKVEEL